MLPDVRRMKRKSENVLVSIHFRCFLVVRGAGRLRIASAMRQQVNEMSPQTRSVQPKPIRGRRRSNTSGHTKPPVKVRTQRSASPPRWSYVPTLEPDTTTPRAVALYFVQLVETAASEG
jgi:hypothetical protein